MDRPPTSANGGPTAGGRRSAPVDMDDFEWQLDRMGHLLRDMVAFGIVRRNEDGVFELHEEVQRRLMASSERIDHPAVAAVFVGRTCQRCGASGVTRMVDGLRLCSACQVAPIVPIEGEVPVDHPHHRRWRLRTAG